MEGKITERMEWLTKDSGIVHMKIEHEVYTDGKLVGTKVEEMKIESSIDDLEKGLLLVKENVGKKIKNKEEITARLSRFKKKPILNSEQIRLRKNLDALRDHEEFGKLTKQLEPLQGQIESDLKFIENRERLIMTAPKK